MIVVIGGTGTTGRALVKALQAKGLDFKCLVRDEAKARETLGADVALVKGDLDDPAALGLAEDLGEACGGEHVAVDEVAQDAAGADAGQLVRVADEDQRGVRRQRRRTASSG